MLESASYSAVNFRNVSLVFSLISACLAAIYLVDPEILLRLFGIVPRIEAVVMARRGGALFLGISILLYRIRFTTDVHVKKGISMGLAVSCAALAILGLGEFMAGHAKAGILMAVFTEVACAACYIHAFKADKNR